MRQTILLSSATAFCGTPEGLLECERICSLHNATLLINEDGTPSCLCSAGFTPNDGSTCVDIDECAAGTDTCPPEVSECVNIPGGYYCGCSAGWLPTLDGRSCERADPCSSQPCGANCCRALAENTDYICARVLEESVDGPVCPIGFTPPKVQESAGMSLRSAASGLLTPQFVIELMSISHRNLMNVLSPLFQSSITPAIATFIASRALAPRSEVVVEPRPPRRTTTTTTSTPAPAVEIPPTVSGQSSRSRSRHKRDESMDDLLMRLLADDELPTTALKGERVLRTDEKRSKRNAPRDDRRDPLSVDGLSEAAIIALLSSKDAAPQSGGRPRRASTNNPSYSSLEFAVQQLSSGQEDAEFHISAGGPAVFDISTMKLDP